jgi:6-phosphofructokinase 1
MINGEFFTMDRKSVSNIIQRGGTILKTARSEQFRTVEGRRLAYDQLKSTALMPLLRLAAMAHLPARVFLAPNMISL